MEKGIVSTWLVILIALVFLVAGAGGAYLYLTYYRQSSVPTDTTPSSPAPSSTTQDSLSRGTLTVSGQTVTFNYLKAWTDLMTPATDEFGKITAGKLKDAYFVSFGLGDQAQEQRKLFENYPYSPDSYDAGGTTINSPAAAIASLQVYPAQLTDDPAEDSIPGLTKAQKEAALEPLLDVYAQKGLGSVSLIKQTWTKGTTGITGLAGGWWDSMMANQDRVGVTYYANKDNTLRGVGFFAFEGQDYNFEPDYRVVLIKPDNRAVVVLTFPLRNHPTLKQFAPANGAAEATVIAKLKEMYAYLNDPENYQGTELETLLSSFADIVESLQLQS